MRQKAQLMDEAALSRALMRISHEITEKNKGVENVVLVGIRRRGVPIAERIRDNILRIEER
ncbi:MAG: bifunctional pyr operon transcriptional regulator/uracil phosphoribosyltransferase, partial [Eubacteriales bacterium]|nr:bifunctional pyr operon transcriptional regulator/uracil phosphoribosyltransferase [Eubacteriales bacterium]